VSTKKKEAVLYTHGDLDGVACAILLKMYLGKKLTVHFCNYDNIDEHIINFINARNKMSYIDELLITDICPSEETCERISKLEDIDIHLLDHHKTKSWVTKYRWATYNSDLCGAEQVAKLTKTPYLEDINFVHAVAAWDLWKIDSPSRKRGEQLNSLLVFMGLHNFMKEFLTDPDLLVDQTPTFQTIIKYIEENKKRKIKQTINNQIGKARRYMDGCGHTYKILFASDYISEIGHAALRHEDEEDLDYVVILNPTTNHCGLRSKGDVDVSHVAKQLRGGGHKAAAGFIVDFRKRTTRTVSNMLSKIEP
jgi:oligoribonuclease NrnB/cAMP/cGMP phosphodiesterase (DHH superfamily)